MTPRPEPVATGSGRRRPRRAVLLALAAALVALLAVVVVMVVSGDDASPETGSPATVERLTRADWDGTLAGVYVGTDPAEVEAFEEFTGQPTPLVVDFSARETWQQIAAPDYLLRAWDGTGRRLVLGVAMLPSDVDGVSIEEGATGAYDDYYRTLADRLVGSGNEDAILRIGWEFNLDSMIWSSDDPETWIQYWRHIVTAMQGVPGQAFRFDWNPNNGGGTDPDPAAFYPGSEYVDYIGVDAYDVAGGEGAYPIPADCTAECAQQRRDTAWTDYVYGGERGLEFWSRFAAERDKQLSLPEWGVWERVDGIGGGDNPSYVELMAEFIGDPANRVGYQSYFEDDNELGTHRLDGDFPESGEQFRRSFGA